MQKSIWPQRSPRTAASASLKVGTLFGYQKGAAQRDGLALLDEVLGQ
jgi:hypothetical protein